MAKEKETKNKSNNIISTMLLHCVFIILAIIVIVPVIWIIGSSFNPGTSIFSSSLFPKNPTLDHYRELFTQTDYLIWFKNTLKVALMSMFFSVIITVMTGYSFSRFKFKGKKNGMMIMLILQMFPAFLAMTAVYIIISGLGLINTHIGLVLVYVTGQIPFNTWLVKGYLDAIPRSLDEAARIDGAGNWTILYRIILPLTAPIVVFVALQNFIGPFFDFIFPQIILRTADKKTLAMGLFAWIKTRAENNYTMFAAGAVLIAVPITILYAYFQKYIVEGLSKGATKG